MRVLAVASQKGGSGKTTTAVHVAVAWAAAGRRVLLVDVDPQGTASHWAGAPPGRGLADVFLRRAPGAGDAVRNTSIAGLDVMPADPALLMVESLTATADYRELALRDALAPLARRYDAAVIDTPPTLGLLTVAALVAAQGVLIPVAGQALALPGLVALGQTVERVRASLNSRLRVAGVLMCRISRTRLAGDVAEAVRQSYGPLLLEAAIPESVRLAEAPGYQQTIFEYAPESAGAVAYREAAAELWARWKP